MSSKPVVAVAMSGGVDSSVAAALLVEQGYSVFGIMLRLWSEQGAEADNRCCTPDSVAMARRVAATLSIPFYVLDAKQIFYEAVVKSFIYDYTHNRTPNPCIACNRLVRWGYLLKNVQALGADYLATGHYARLVHHPEQPIQLLRGIDAHKDQSYVLHVLTQEQLAHAMFPLGEYTKPAVRELAQKLNLPVAQRPDSQDLCFIGGDGDYRQFLARHAPQSLQPGNIIDRQGNILGQHPGLPLFTIGQRKGLHIAAPSPLYVIEKDFAHNTLTVGGREHSGKDVLVANDVNWISGVPPDAPLSALVKIRYQVKDIPGEITMLHNSKIKVQFENTLQDITPGQAAVIYNGDICLGGGIIADSTE